MAEILELRKQNIRLCIRGNRKGAAAQFAYAYIGGHQMLLAKKELPHGNKDRDAAIRGLQQWLGREFNDISYRTCARWMQFAADFDATVAQLKSDPEKSATVSLFTKRPLMLKKGKLNSADSTAFMKVMPHVMDGKGMIAFMRDSRLLRDPLPIKPSPRKPLSPDKALAAKQKQAERVWTTILGDLHLGVPLAQHLPDDTRFSTARELAKHLPPLARGLPKKLTDELAGLLADTTSLVRTQSPASPTKKARP